MSSKAIRCDCCSRRIRKSPVLYLEAVMRNTVKVPFLLCRNCGTRVETARVSVDAEGAEMLRLLEQKARTRAKSEVLRLIPIEAMHHA